MSYKTSERDKAILDIASGHADLKNISLYENMASFNWITLTRSGNKIQGVALTYSGDQLYRKLLKNIED